MTQNSKTAENIDIRLFYTGKGRGEGWASQFIRNLEVDRPVPINAPPTTKPQSVPSAISQASKRLEIPVAMRTIDGTLYAMRLRDEPDAE